MVSSGWGYHDGAGVDPVPSPVSWNIGDQAVDMGDSLPVLFEDVDDVATFIRLTCLLKGGEVKCFGDTSNWIVYLGSGTKTANNAVTWDLDGFAVDRLGGGWRNVCAISSGGDLEC